MKYLVDTCVLSEFAKDKRNRLVVEWFQAQDEEDLAVSVLTLGEIHRGIQMLTSSRRRNDLEKWERSVETQFQDRVLSFGLEESHVWARLMANLDTQGTKMPILDSLLAAVAITHRLVLVTRNVADFQHTGLKIVNPWDVH